MMRPAFSSTRSAAAFALLLLVLLALPVLVGKNLLPPREQAYAVQAWGNGPFPWIRNQIFEETNAVDIAFLGSSHIFNAINTPHVQADLSAKLGRPAVVRTIAWGGAGYDGLYFIAQDLLAHRRVRMIVFYDENPAGANRNNVAVSWFRWADNSAALAGLPLPDQSLFYFASIVGMPRNLLSLVRPNLPAPLVTDQPNYWTIIANAPNPATQLGCLSVRKGFAPTLMSDAAPFLEFRPATAAAPTDAVVFSTQVKTNFEFSSAPLLEWQVHFAKKLAELFRQNRVQPVMLHLPVLAEVRGPVMSERADWPEIFGGDCKLLGIPPAKLFGGLSDRAVLKLYGDPVHFNRNGQEYFTSLITPALINLYETKSSH
jgi:hypothetical protein